MAVAQKYSLAAAGSTGNNTHTAVQATGRANDQVAVQFVVEVAGATPTITWKVQGSEDNVNWYDLLYVTDASDTASAATRVATAVGTQIEFVDAEGTAREYAFFRLVTTANTNITYRGEIYFFEDASG